MLNWENEYPKKELNNLTNIFGEPAIAENKGGFAIWNKDQIKNNKYNGMKLCFNEIILRDEAILHFCPSKHYDFLYSSIIVPVKPNQIELLSGISGSVIYDALKNTVTARCASIEANIATLNLCTKVLLDVVDLDEVHMKGTYGKMIQSTGNKESIQKLNKELCNNVKKLNERKLNKGFWPGAFSLVNQTCGPPDKLDKPSDKPSDKVNNKSKKKRKDYGLVNLYYKKTRQYGGDDEEDKPDKSNRSHLNNKQYRDDDEDIYNKKYIKYKHKYIKLKNK